MRYHILLPALLLCAVIATAQEPASDKSVQFDGNTLLLATSNKDPNTGESLKEYIPQGENIDKWNKFAAVHVFPNKGGASPLEMVAALVKTLNEQYPGAPSAVIKNPTTGDAIVDFVIVSNDATYAEFNVMKYMKGPNGTIIMNQYGLRAYGDDAIKAFLTGLKPVRLKLRDEMVKTNFTGA